MTTPVGSWTGAHGTLGCWSASAEAFSLPHPSAGVRTWRPNSRTLLKKLIYVADIADTRSWYCWYKKLIYCLVLNKRHPVHTETMCQNSYKCFNQNKGGITRRNNTLLFLCVLLFWFVTQLYCANYRTYLSHCLSVMLCMLVYMANFSWNPGGNTASATRVQAQIFLKPKKSLGYLWACSRS